MDASKLAKQVVKLISDNAPAILSTIGVMGVVSSAVLASKAGSKIREGYSCGEEGQGRGTDQDRGRCRRLDELHPHSPRRGNVCCLHHRSTLDSRQASGGFDRHVHSSGGQLPEYKDKVKELTTGPKETKVRDELAQDRVNNNPASGKGIYMAPNSGDVLCYDTLSGRYFEGDMETLRRAQNDINEILLKDDYASQNDFYERIGLPSNGYGSEFGWTTDVMLDLQFSTVLSEDNRPCISIDYRMLPIRGYHKFG